MITVISFGFRNGVPKHDLLVDARVLRNVKPGMIYRNALAPEVMEHILKSPNFEELLARTKERITDKLMDGKDCVVAIGCGYGRHRSVAVAYFITRWLRHLTTERVELIHRDRQGGYARA